MHFNENSAFCTLNGKPLKFVDQFIYLGSNIASTERNVNTYIGKASTANDWLTNIWESNITGKIKQEFFQVETMSVLLVWLHHLNFKENLKKKLNGNYTNMLHAVLNKSWKQHPKKQQLYGYLPPPHLTNHSNKMSKIC